MDVLRRHAPTFWLAVAGVVGMLLGTIGPWMVLFGTATPDTGEKVCLIGVAFVAAAFLWHHAQEGGRGAGAAGMLLGAIGALTCGVALYDVMSWPDAQIPGQDDYVSPGWGVYVSLLGSLALAGASYLLWRDPTY